MKIFEMYFMLNFFINDCVKLCIIKMNKISISFLLRKIFIVF